MRAVSWFGAMVGCGSVPSTLTTTGDQLPPVRLEAAGEFAGKSNNQGRLAIEVEVPAGAVSLQATADSEVYVTLDELVDPDGNTVLLAEDWLFEDESLTNAFFPYHFTTAFDWPIRANDDPLTPGLWTLWFQTTNSGLGPIAQTRAHVVTEVKHDPDLTQGTLGVQIVWADGVEEERGVEDAITQAVERWREVWADSGITLVERYRTSNLDPRLGFTYLGDDKVENVAGTKTEGELQLVIGETVFGDEFIFGVSGGIPGTVRPSPYTFVVLAWLTHAGVDGEFDDNEIRLMGETMAHETGHYAGLFHPVEAYYDRWDALGDTERCTGYANCNDALGRNVMFPYPLCDFSGCSPQGALTDEQTAVLQRFIGTL